ncbi:MAG: cation:proton antiporter [Deltaproteobacteria bacterium]|nr:cation:proton antiporter [Deltaproteobacteria bacterium]MBW1953063.1 cation:proton antiporter [Deltaproteobacteria bacterium]MBW1986703.1 cation:proton antiporter [Deltaproteobacteria bacterium]MBW2134549.1 cation:proton antiporter [Deltaproteobacteria bacterium]
MISHPLLAVGLLLILGYWGGRAANAINLPRISGYLVAGMLLSPSFSNILSRRVIDEDLYIITEIALGIIAYSIGGSLVYERLKRLGKIILWISVSQAVGAFLVTAVLLTPALPWLTGLRGPDYQLFATYLPMALIIGAISVATAPGAVLAIIAELRASGPFTTTLLGVIALDDGLAIIFFALAETAAHVLINPEAVSWLRMIVSPVREIGFSLLLGGLAGMGLKFMARLVRRREALFMVILGVLFSTSGVAILLRLSPLLANMVVGFIIVNLERRHHDFFMVIEQIEEPLFGLFFGLAGAHLDLGVFKSAGLLALTIIICRISGKELGAWVGGQISRAPKVIKKYLGLALFPKAGVTVGLVLAAREIFPQPLVASILVGAVIGSVIINELIAPPLVKYALLRADEISHTSKPLSQEG